MHWWSSASALGALARDRVASNPRVAQNDQTAMRLFLCCEHVQQRLTWPLTQGVEWNRVTTCTQVPTSQIHKSKSGHNTNSTPAPRVGLESGSTNSVWWYVPNMNDYKCCWTCMTYVERWSSYKPLTWLMAGYVDVTQPVWIWCAQ